MFSFCIFKSLSGTSRAPYFKVSPDLISVVKLLDSAKMGPRNRGHRRNVQI